MTSFSKHYKAVLFDFDGTLTQPGALDFSKIKRKIGCPLDEPILEFIKGLPDANDRLKATRVLEEMEMRGAETSAPNPDAESVVFFLKENGLKIGLITRNGEKPVFRALKNFDRLEPADFDVIITRETPVKPKPSGDGVLLAAREMSVDPSELLVVGDYLFDIEAGKNAGSDSALLATPKLSEDWANAADHRISNLLELKKLILFNETLPAGKLPHYMLESFLGGLDLNDPSLIIPPGIGEDIAAIDVDDAEILVLKSDPITFVTDEIGYYSIIINSNDVYTSGARPRWFLASILFPVGASSTEALKTLNELHRVCGDAGVALCGGHTEITDAVNRTVVNGMMVGVVSRNQLIDKKSMRKGDIVLLSKGVAVEGTAIIASEFADRLKQLGLEEEMIRKCRDRSRDISIKKEAVVAGAFKEVTAMHDVTEGGLAGALYELSCAGRHLLSVQMDKIPIFQETKLICDLLDINPLGLIGSGSLLICCRPEIADSLMKSIRKAGPAVCAIGEVLEPGRGVDATENGKSVSWPQFEVDEITHLYA